MSDSKAKPARNFGDTMMSVGVVMIVLSILLPMFNFALSETMNMFLWFGGLGVAVLGWAQRNQLRRKANR